MKMTMKRWTQKKFYLNLQNDTDTIQNNTVRFFVYTDLNNWGFFIVPIQRKADQLYLGRKEYFPYEDNLSENSYFDGNH